MSPPVPAPNEALRTPFYDAAQDILATEGHGGLKLSAVCRRVGVTTGAFYHSFHSWQEFTDALLAHWRRQRTTVLIETSREVADPVAQLQLLAALSAGLQHRTEAAIRAWAHRDTRVAQVQRQVDDERYDIVHEAARALVGEEAAPRFASWALSTLVGYEQLDDRCTPDDLLWALQQMLDVALRMREQPP